MSKQLQTIEFRPPAITEAQNFRRVMELNFAGRALEPTDLSRAKFPTGGGSSWTCENEEGEEDQQKDITGVVIVQHAANAYWEGDFKGAEAPQCASNDGMVGIGDPGGNCGSCEFNKPGSGTGGKWSRACKNMHRLFILTEGELLPLLVVLPPASVKSWFKYMQFLSRRGKAFFEVVTSITLESTKNADGISYSEARFKKVGDLSGGTIPDIETVRASFLPTAKTLDVSAEDYSS